jgi:DNA-binding response OmpR family regulator
LALGARSEEDNPVVRNPITRPVHKVLIVDDEQLVADTRVILFKSAGYDARAASSAEEALELIADWCPDLAILDVVLPKMNGIDLAVLLRARYPNCTIALSSSHPATEDLLTAAAALGHSFQLLVKPAHPQELLSLAAQLGHAK